MVDQKEVDDLGDVFECVAMTLFEILRAAFTPEADTGNLREGARNIARKLIEWDEGGRH